MLPSPTRPDGRGFPARQCGSRESRRPQRGHRVGQREQGGGVLAAPRRSLAGEQRRTDAPPRRCRASSAPSAVAGSASRNVRSCTSSGATNSASVRANRAFTSTRGGSADEVGGRVHAGRVELREADDAARLREAPQTRGHLVGELGGAERPERLLEVSAIVLGAGDAHAVERPAHGGRRDRLRGTHHDGPDRVGVAVRRRRPSRGHGHLLRAEHHERRDRDRPAPAAPARPPAARTSGVGPGRPARWSARAATGRTRPPAVSGR